MNKTLFLIRAATVIGSLSISACGGAGDDVPTTVVDVDDQPPSVTFKPSNEGMVTHKPQGPIAITYRIVGQPIVGQPVAIDLRVTSTFGPQPVSMSYRINDASAMKLTEAQPQKVMLTQIADQPFMTEQVSIIPQREGRLYLNVSASVPTADGSFSTVTAIPIQVGEGTRDLIEQGELKTGTDGNDIRVLPGADSN